MRAVSRLEPTVVKILSNSIRSVVPPDTSPGDNIEIRRTCQRPNRPFPRLEIHRTRREWAQSFLSRFVLIRMDTIHSIENSSTIVDDEVNVARCKYL